MNSIDIHSNASSTRSSPERNPVSKPKSSKNQTSKSKEPIIDDDVKKELKKVQYKNRQQKTGEFIKELKTTRTENGKQIRKLNESVDEMKIKMGDMKHRVDELEDERLSLIDDISAERVTNDELTEELSKTKASRQNYKDNFKDQRVINTDINEEISNCKKQLELSKKDVTKWQHQANCERKKRKIAESELSKKRCSESRLNNAKSVKAKEYWQKQTGELLHDFATLYSKWLNEYQNHALENELILPTPSKKPRMCYPESPDSR